MTVAATWVKKVRRTDIDPLKLLREIMKMCMAPFLQRLSMLWILKAAYGTEAAIEKVSMKKQPCFVYCLLQRFGITYILTKCCN